MVSLERLAKTALHYLVMLLLIFLALTGVRMTLGDVGFFFELLLVLVIAFLYPAVVRRLGIAPPSWQRNSS